MLDKEDYSKNILLYVLMGAMLITEIYMYVACVVRADRKIHKEKIDNSLARGFVNMLSSVKTKLLNE